MLSRLPWKPIQAIAWDSLQSILCKIPGFTNLSSLLNQSSRLLLPSINNSTQNIPVFVMMPLDTACENRIMSLQSLEKSLRSLHDIGITGVMIDVWWALCEPQPLTYHFQPYIQFFNLCKQIGLKVQATLSFHSCGGNVGDTVNIPLPKWVHQAAETHNFWFTDRNGNLIKEYISFGADHQPVLPGKKQSDQTDTIPLRTPIETYTSFIKAFIETMKSEGFLDSTIVEFQIGMGPCGELRYPSYPLADGKWKFPGIGQFQCFDQYLLKDLQENVDKKASEFVKQCIMPPENTGSYNDTPWDTQFFRKDVFKANGIFFLKWYSSKLLQHGEDILKQTKQCLIESNVDIKLAMKISGIHWWKFTKTRAAEATAGYMIRPGVTAYEDIAQLCEQYNVILDFTCLEMRTIDQPFLKARCGPNQLVQEVFRHAYKANVQVAGENALERLDWGAYSQILSSFRKTRAQACGFTLLRLGENMVKEENLETLKRFVDEMNCIYK